MRVTIGLLILGFLQGEEWPRFRGANGGGVGESKRLPAEIGPDRNVIWKIPLPPGHSSPVIWGDRIFLTGAEGGARGDAGRDKVWDEGGRLFTYAVDRRSGELLWKREAPRPRLERYQPTNSPASPSAATDGRMVYVFFGDYGLIAYGVDGSEKWKAPLGPFNNVNGHGTSPIVADDLVVLLCDQDTDSFLLAVDKATGRVRWKTTRPRITRSYTTPGLLRPARGPSEIIVPGAYSLISYSAATGEKLWWVGGMSWQPKSTPVIDGETIYAHWWESGGEAETVPDTPAWEQILGQYDANKDGRVSVDEYARDAKGRRGFENNDLNGDGYYDRQDWDNARARRASRNALVAVRGGGRGDVSESHVLWRMQKFLPNVPSPLLYDGVMYLVKDGGILTSLDAKTGRILKQGRLPGAVDTYYSSPVGAAGKVYMISQQGKATVLKAGGEWEVLWSGDFEDEVYATPAITGEAIYVRTRGHLYKFAASR